MRHFCTAFDRNFLTRGLALYRSPEAHLAALDAAANDGKAAHLSAPAARYNVRSVIGGAAQSLLRGQLLVAPGGFGR